MNSCVKHSIEKRFPSDKFLIFNILFHNFRRKENFQLDLYFFSGIKWLLPLKNIYLSILYFDKNDKQDYY